MGQLVVLVVAAVALLSCDGQDSSPAILDLDAGTYGGVGLGSTPAELRTRFGEGESAPDGPAAPLGEEFSEIGGALSIPLPNKGRVMTRDILRYEDVAFLLADERVFAIVVTAGGPVGDNLEEVSRAYTLRCGRTSGAPDYHEYPYCVGKLDDRRFVWFGEDPIASITVSETSLLRGA
jgi:hypothetical protein